MKFHVFSVAIDHKSDKDYCKTDSKNYLSLTKHIFLFLAKVAKKQSNEKQNRRRFSLPQSF